MSANMILLTVLSMTLLSFCLETAKAEFLQLVYSVTATNRSCATSQELVTFTCETTGNYMTFSATQFSSEGDITFLKSDGPRTIRRSVGFSTFTATSKVDGNLLTSNLTVVASEEVNGTVSCTDGMNTEEEVLCILFPQLALPPGDQSVPYNFNSNVTFRCEVEGGVVVWEVNNIQLVTDELRMQQEQNNIFIVDLPPMGDRKRSELRVTVEEGDTRNNTLVRCIGVDAALNTNASSQVRVIVFVQQFTVVPVDQMVPSNFNNNNVTFQCEVDDGTVIWEVNNVQLLTPELRMLQEQNNIFIVDFPPMNGRVRSELRFMVDDSGVLNNEMMVRCIGLDTALNTNVSDYVRIIIFDAPETPRNLTLALGQQNIRFSWDPPSNLPLGVETTYNVTVVNPDNGTVYPEFPMNRVNMTFVEFEELETSCQLYKFIVIAEDDAGSSDPAVINVTIPITPNVTSVSDSLMATVSFSRNDVLISLSFNRAVACSALSYNISLNGENVMFPDQDSDPVMVTLRSNETSALQADVEYNIIVTACNSLTCLQAEPTTAVTTDVQSASVTFVGSDVLLSCELAEGSSARGCVFIFTLNNDTERFNVSRSDTMGVQRKKQMDTWAEVCQTTLRMPDAYDSVEVVDWESDGSEGTLPMTVVPQEDPDTDNFVCPPSPPGTDSGSDVDVGLVVGLVVGLTMGLTVVIVVIAAVIVIICIKKKDLKREAPPTTPIEMNKLQNRTGSDGKSKAEGSPPPTYVEPESGAALTTSAHEMGERNRTESDGEEDEEEIATSAHRGAPFPATGLQGGSTPTTSKAALEMRRMSKQAEELCKDLDQLESTLKTLERDAGNPIPGLVVTERVLMAEGTSKSSSEESAVIVISSGDEGVPQQLAVFTPTKRPPSLSEDSSEESTDEGCGFTKSAGCRKRIKFEVLSGSDSDNSEGPPDDPVMQHYGGDTELPIFSTTQCGYHAENVARCLLNPSLDRVCHVQPMGVTRSATFVVDIDDVEFVDLKADDLGVWKTNGTKTTHFRILPSGRIWIASSKRKAPSSSYYVITRRYYVHGTYHRFRRIIIDIRDVQGKRHKYAMVQYLLDGPEVEIKIKPHGNSKQDRPYFRTSGSTKSRIKNVASSHTPKDAINLLTMEQGGELQARGAASLPRDRRQIKYARDQKQLKDPNPLYSIMLECKLAQGKCDLFVQDVKAAPQPMCVLSSEWQLDDMVRFLTGNHRFGVLTVDTTYNLGDFYVTPLVYPHLMLEDVQTGKPPLLLGPILVHQSVDFSAFNYFASTLIGCRRDLRHLMVCGTDGDKALVEALTHSFPYAVQLRCFIHFRRNVEEKLRDLGLPSSVSEEFLDDIFGKRIGNTFQEGLVDSCSVDEVEERLRLLKPVWDARESVHAPASGPRFHSFFCKYQADVVKYHMRKDLREAAGLGCPPAKFTTNSSESINAAIKRHVNCKESEWPKFNDEMKQLITSQREEVIRALSGRGQYRLGREFSHYVVSTQEWMRMRPEQRQIIVNNFQKATIPMRSQAATCCGGGESSIASVSEKGECSTASSDGKVLPFTVRTPSRRLHVSAEDSGITTIPLITLEGMWAKADKLLSTENTITPAPGGDKKARMVLSYSQVAPHLIQSKSDGQYSCDSNCLQWTSSQICSHTLAAAEYNGDLASFLLWYTRCAENPNISTLAMSGLSRGRGRKGGKAKRQRTRKQMPPPDNYTVRPGLQSTLAKVRGVVNAGTLVNIEGGAETVHAISNSMVLPESNTLLGSAAVAYTRGPPPLLSFLPSQSQVANQSRVTPPTAEEGNVNPFYVKPLQGNVRVCQGCRGSLRLPDGAVPAPPFDIVVARVEKRCFRDSAGILRTPSRPSAAHYHPEVLKQVAEIRRKSIESE